MTKLFQNYTAYAIKYVILAFIASTLFSCEDDPDLGSPPTVGFEVTLKVAEVGELLSFTNSSTSADSTALTYQWDFGDGDQSTNASPSHFYSDTGIYVVSLSATTAMGASEVIEKEILIGRRYLKSLELLNWTDSTIDFAASTADTTILRPWDEDGSAPDIAWVLLGPNNQGIDTRTEPTLNVTQMPFILEITGDFLLQNDFYVVAIGDVDEVADSVDWMVIRQNDDFAPTNPNATIHESSTNPLGEREFTSGKNPITGEGSVIVGGEPNQPYFDLAVGLLNFEIR